MRFRIAFLLSAFAVNAFAVAPQFWRVRTVEDFLAGDIQGFAVTSRGQLRLAPALTKIATISDPFVLSQTNAPGGDRFFGTGNDGKVYRLRSSDLKAIYTAPEPEIYAVALRDGALYVASSPNGKVYRVDPESGKGEVFFDPKQAYIWALQFDGSDLLVATGVEGKLFRVSPKGEGKVIFTAPETHVRSLAIRSNRAILAGGAGKGRIYEITSDGSAHALYDSPLGEISALYVDASGTAWASAVTASLPASAPPKSTVKPAQTTTTSTATGTTGAAGEPKKEPDPGTPTVEVSFAADDAGAGVPAGAGELYRINADGFVEVVRKFDREMIYGITDGPGGSLLLSTGQQGRVYSCKDGEIALIAAVPEKQVVSISSAGGATTITTTNSGAVYRLENAQSTTAEFRSAAKDVDRFSRFGHYRLEGTDLGDGRVAISFRSGNTRTPDATWSNWSAPSAAVEGTVSAPPARYVQWKLTSPKPSAGVAIDSVTVAYVNRNVAPVIDNVTVQDPAVVFVSSSYSTSPQVVEATNPDEYGIFNSLEAARDKNDPGKKAFRKGYRTVTWRAHDENGDPLRYFVSFRRKGSDRWLRLRDNIEESQINFDTSQMPDGPYELRLVASDAVDNAEAPLSDAHDSIEFEVDNTAPSIKAAAEGESVVVHVTDAASPVGKVEFSADAQKWIRMVPVDGIADSPDETYRLPRSAVSGKFVVVRAVDAFYNIATESITLP